MIWFYAGEVLEKALEGPPEKPLETLSECRRDTFEGKPLVWFHDLNLQKPDVNSSNMHFKVHHQGVVLTWRSAEEGVGNTARM